MRAFQDWQYESKQPFAGRAQEPCFGEWHEGTQGSQHISKKQQLEKETSGLEMPLVNSSLGLQTLNPPSIKEGKLLTGTDGSQSISQ